MAAIKVWPAFICYAPALPLSPSHYVAAERLKPSHTLSEHRRGLTCHLQWSIVRWVVPAGAALFLDEVLSSGWGKQELLYQELEVLLVHSVVCSSHFNGYLVLVQTAVLSRAGGQGKGEGCSGGSQEG